jgi:DNA invertase Pin-like site-specific DNA recombinase
MSTEHQRYSPINQAAAIAAYAHAKGYEVVKTYADEGSVVWV